MTLSAKPATKSTVVKWKNLLPEWIFHDPQYAKLKAQERAALNTIADRCDRPRKDGNLVNCFGGKSLEHQIGGSHGWVWKTIGKLIQAGFVVEIGRGGFDGNRNIANNYGIPGARGSLDLLAVERRKTKNGAGGARPAKFHRKMLDEISHVEPADIEVKTEHGNLTKGFAAFWDRYPGRKYGKNQCIEVWEAGGLEANAVAIIKGLNAWKKCDEWTKEDGRFVKSPVEFLREARWEAIPAKAKPAPHPSDDIFTPRAMTEEDIAAMPTREELEAWEKEQADMEAKWAA